MTVGGECAVSGTVAVRGMTGCKFVPDSLDPGFGCRLVIGIAFPTGSKATSAKFFQSLIEFLRSATKIGIVFVPQPKDREVEFVESRSGIGLQPGPEIGSVIRRVAFSPGA